MPNTARGATIKRWVRDGLAAAGLEVRRYRPTALPDDRIDLFPDPDFRAAWRLVRPYTMTTPERGYALWCAVNHACDHCIPGDFVECGVWRGGSTMLAGLAFKARGRSPDLWLYDTFEGMTPPTDHDQMLAGSKLSAAEALATDQWYECRASLDDVQANVALISYDAQKVHYIQGRCEDTVWREAAKTISILRLDTDWYKSTVEELKAFWPKLSVGGIMIADDYGFWAGQRKALHEFFAGKDVFFCPTDFSGCILLKT